MSNPENTPSELQLKLARDILAYIRSRQLREGTHLKEQELANVFKVSRSPIRGALKYLSEKNAIEQRERRGFFIGSEENVDRLADLTLPKTSQERLCIDITKDWLQKKVPQTFSEAEFRDRYDLGRLVASRVLLQLADDGIIARKPGRGWEFLPTLDTEVAYNESFDFRMSVETGAILAQSFKLDASLAQLSRSHHDKIINAPNENMPLGDFFEADAEFHNLIGVSSGNRFFKAAIEQQNALRRTLEYETIYKVRVLESCIEHMKILDALEVGQRNYAAELMRRHLEVSKDFEPGY